MMAKKTLAESRKDSPKSPKTVKPNQRPARVKVTEAGSYWGKMFLKTREMRVSLRLIEKREECIDYLVLHELAHLRYPDHGAAFHAFLDRFLPGNRALERLLKS